MCATRQAIWDAYAANARTAAEELLPAMIQIARYLGADYFEELILESQEKARRDAELFECGREMVHEQLREEDE